MNKQYKRTLTIAGSDSGGGAGIQADLKTFSALGCYGMSVITALTAQNTQGVTAIHAAPSTFIADQMDAVLTDIGTDAVKIGMLHNPELIEIVADRLHHYQITNIVLDPVMVAKGGDKLIQDDAIDALKKHLLPMASVITPNLPEAEVFLGHAINNHKEMEMACEELIALGAQAVLLKGSRLSGEKSRDIFYQVKDKMPHTLDADRYETNNTHGTGCTLSSAIAAHLAHGQPLDTAISKAKDYISQAIKEGANYQLGNGHGPVHHFYSWW